MTYCTPSFVPVETPRPPSLAVIDQLLNKHRKQKTTYSTICKAPQQIVEHQFLFKRQSRKTAREAETLSLSDRGE